MKRRLFTILSALSLLLFVAVVVLWVRSIFFRNEVVMLSRGHQCFIVYNMRGVVTVRWDTRPDEQEAMFGVIHSQPSDDFDIKQVFDWDFLARHERIRYDLDRAFTTQRWLRSPHWLLAIALLIPPAISARWFGRRRQPGLCPGCGYDLRATPDRCPECGTAPTKAPG